MNAAGVGAMPRAVLSYVAGVVFLGLAGTVLTVMAHPAPIPLGLLFCVAMFLVGEAITFETPTRKGNVSMAAMVHVAMVPVLSPSTLALSVWCTRLPAELMVKRRPWYKALFNASQISLSVIAAGLLFDVLGPGAPVTLDRESLLRVLPSLAPAAAAYYVVNHGLVSGVIALLTGSPYRTAWRENFGGRAQLVTAGAGFLAAPVATVVCQTVGEAGLVVFAFPMLLLRDACRRYFELENAQRALIGSERMAAKGEMAASVAHELNNYLSVLGGNLQILHRRGPSLDEEARAARLEKGLEQVRNMAALSKGLMEFSQLGSKPSPTDVRRLVEETVEFLRPQNRFDPVSLSVDCDPRVGTVTLDPAQIQQVLMNLLNNAADAMRDEKTRDRAIWVTVGLRSAQDKLEITVTDSGPGVPEEIRGKILEPGFTTKHDGHGFGLSTVYRIVENHGGTLSVERSAINGRCSGS